ncbi:NACHT domain-containing protein [Leptolyngbya sp. AN03gr2]|uniref:NACHT domain-containing protein n=1 Tax=unclassified Leptolyngbya TaxID=2650499 RepID=UPI003D31A61B
MTFSASPKYQESLQFSYGYLKLYTLDSTDRTDAIKLWNIFIEQTVREALPPMRYELPLDLKRQLQEQGQLEADLSSEALERYRQEYFQQPARKVLEAVAESQRAVILGDPGAGKSTLLQYLALGWVGGKTDALPLLIELREYAIAQTNNFLEFLHRGRGVDWQFDQQQLHQYLQDNPALMMFDGLDEVFDRATQAAIVDDMIRFAQQYPKAQILVTSRVIGYNPDRLQQAGFRHFTIQSLDTDEIHEFIDRWYSLALGNDADKSRLVTRLKGAIANSKAIQNLADNPLLLTMMAILNRRQELPRNRADLYDQASRVLLYHWDVDHKRLQLPMDAIGRREKQEMLRLIAYEMQAGEEGLKGNLISAERLTQVLTDYLRNQGFSESREKANHLIQQLRERNFILCYRGADSYGFVHRTFLEYFCAMEIVYRFEKQRTLSFEQLRDEVFGQTWRDETWHEALCLIIGMLGENVTANILTYLIEQDDVSDYDENGQFIDRDNKPKFFNLYLVANCLEEVQSCPSIKPIAEELLRKLKYLAMSDLDGLTSTAVLEAIATTWKNDSETLLFLKACARESEGLYAPDLSVSWIARQWKDDPDTLPWLQACALDGEVGSFSAMAALANYWQEDPDTFTILKSYAQSNENSDTINTLIKAIAQGWANQPSTHDFLSSIVVNHSFKRENKHQKNPRQTALEALFNYYPAHPKTVELLHDRSINDSDALLREWARHQLEQMENGSA